MARGSYNSSAVSIGDAFCVSPGIHPRVMDAPVFGISTVIEAAFARAVTLTNLPSPALSGRGEIGCVINSRLTSHDSRLHQVGLHVHVTALERR